jgi:hypothetical protein
MVMEAAMNVNTILQAIGRVHRLGQTKEQKIWILFAEHTFNRYIEWNNTRKMLSQLAGENAGVLASKVREMVGKTGSDSDARRDVIEKETESMLMKLLGQSRSRMGFDNWLDLGRGQSLDSKASMKKHATEEQEQHGDSSEPATKRRRIASELSINVDNTPSTPPPPYSTASREFPPGPEESTADIPTLQTSGDAGGDAQVDQGLQIIDSHREGQTPTFTRENTATSALSSETERRRSGMIYSRST